MDIEGFAGKAASTELTRRTKEDTAGHRRAQNSQWGHKGDTANTPWAQPTTGTCSAGKRRGLNNNEDNDNQQ